MTPLTTPQAVRDAAVKIARDLIPVARRSGQEDRPAGNERAVAYENIAAQLEALPIAPDDRDEKIARLQADLNHASTYAKEYAEKIRKAVEHLERAKQSARDGMFSSAATHAERALTELTGGKKP